MANKVADQLDRSLSRLDTIWSVAERFGAWPVIGALASGGLAAATDVFTTYAPWSWFGAAMTGAVGFQFIKVGRSWSKEKAENARRIANLQEPKGQINPLDETFERKRVFLSDLTPSIGSTVKGKRFIDCEIVGPGVILFYKNVTNINAHFGNCDFVRLAQGPTVQIQNLLAFEDCLFQNCSMIEMTILAPTAILNEIQRAAGGDSLNVITD